MGEKEDIKEASSVDKKEEDLSWSEEAVMMERHSRVLRIVEKQKIVKE